MVAVNTVVNERSPPDASSLNWYEGVNEIVSKRIQEFKGWLHREQVRFNTAIGGHIDIIADVMGSGACGDLIIDPAPPESLEEISIPKHHYEAILGLYQREPAVYKNLLSQADAYIDRMKALNDEKNSSSRRSVSVSASAAGSREALATIIASYS